MKKGDRVRVTRSAGEVRVGEIGTIRKVMGGGVDADFDDRRRGIWLPTDMFELVTDKVNQPDHYKWLPVEAIEITENFNFCMGNALKYIIRADHKDDDLEDLKKARWYIDREIQRREQLQS